VVRNYCGYSEERLYDLTLPQLELDYYMAIKAQKRQAEMIAANLMG
jgi:hypothetical protein